MVHATGSQTLEEPDRYLPLCRDSGQGDNDTAANSQAIKSAPLFSWKVQKSIQDSQGDHALRDQVQFSQYGLLGTHQATFDGTNELKAAKSTDSMIFANMNAPWSAFICGSQGSGKSHTLSCLLENALLKDDGIGKIQEGLSGIVFHYDKFTSPTSHQICEAAWLSSPEIPVRILVSPSNKPKMDKAYGQQLTLPKGSPKPEIVPFILDENDLNVSNMMSLMAVNQESAHPPLYLEIVTRILRRLAKESNNTGAFSYRGFRSEIARAGFSKDQLSALNQRLQLLEEFMPENLSPYSKTSRLQSTSFEFKPGTLTIVDLSDPCIDQNQDRSEAGRIIVLDEAHKFLTQSGEAMHFTDQLVSIICQQRHLASRVLIATQEPTLSPRLLDLCTVSIVHRFQAPKWFETLKDHLAAAGLTKPESSSGILKSIVRLRTGEALVFSPTAILDVPDSQLHGPVSTSRIMENLIPLQEKYIRINVRKRKTTDGGKDILSVNT
ncbi:MAG: hypothetical protein Q9227_001632 [Pyrenula ochraceoflavens]